ncbi:MAG TPA: biotin carboxylase N-terminal domain-containing protein, partial [Vicinamibacterales bacterium]|nr:biotin carboxylase N-terminal domain-containing protein [Vicinamibacterales bacterium]
MRRVLIANRGEIARRIIRTCREMGLATVAVYSEVDADAPYVSEADQALPIGPAAAAESYLNIPRVIEAARRSKADAVHPGYGFLSENPAFADACAEAGLTFVGPPGAVIRRTGSKTAARASVSAAGVPIVPGETPASQEEDEILRAMTRVGFPVLLKATSGGGGRGMRIVRQASEATEAIGLARREAQRAFADGTLYVERLIERPRHVEVQIFADQHGHVVHVLERDCTLQRRHQKVVEETPAPALAPSVRERLLSAAVAAARAVGYVNAGTVEFLVEGEGDAATFYFLEVNTRLQVEHPITEAITGFDLVRAQLLVASGEPLPFAQADVRANGHAIECRIYAEDSMRLLPQSGRLLRYREPSGPGIRVDSGVREGQGVTVHYDPLLAKLIAHGATREEALARMMEALAQYEILGVRHNLAFLRALLARPEVVGHNVHTRFIEEHLDELTRAPRA